jgi:uncharacterized protein (TIGR03437 family)
MGNARLFSILLLAAAMVAPASAQLLSNATLNGAYYFRYLGANTDPSDSARSFQGTLTFDGAGKYTVAGQGAAAIVGGLKPLTSGVYYVSSNGLFYMTNPVDASGETFLWGGVGDGAIVASSTDTFHCDTFVAFPVSTASSNATLTGTYQVAHLEFLNGDFSQSRDTFFTIAANGAGSLGNLTIKGTAQNLRSAATTQTSSGATYTVTANGTGTLNFPAPEGLSAANTLLAGNKVMYVSPDGSLFIAGTATGYDMVIGIKAFSGNAPNTQLSGLYFNTLLENYAAGTAGDGLYAAQGTANELGNGKEIAHQRTNPDGFPSYDFTYSGSFDLTADGTVAYSDSTYGLGAGGKLLVGAGVGTNYQLTLYVKARAVSGTGVFLNPQAIVNKANNVPFSGQVAPGEYLDAYGSGLANSTVTADAVPFPTTLGGVQVTINGTAVPLLYVSPTYISFINPFTSPTDGSFLKIQVTNNGTASNIAEVYSGATAPGIFTIPPGGIGHGAIQHGADFSLVSEAKPAKAGETVVVYMTGLGKVSGTTVAGSAAPSSPFAVVSNPVEVYVDGLRCTVVAQLLTPGSVNLYQLNVTLPSNLEAGIQNIEIATVDGDNYQATIPIGQ